MWKEFKEFAVEGNVLDLAVGVIIAGAFGLIVSSLVDDIIMPIVGAITGGVDFSNLFAPLVQALLGRDEYLLLHDYRSYIDCQAAVSRRYAEREAWVRSSILNTARIGKFSSDRAMREYAEEIWRVAPLRVDGD